jgi:class 3 adenylate cyclase
LPPSNIREIAKLESAASLLRTSLQSFSSFVPLDVVRQLIKSGIPLALGVEPRQLTLFFSDLENFSSHSETLAPADLLVQISTYLEEVSGAIAEEGGTVDKFIGDGVMAFWNAPVLRADHVLRGCAGALRAARRMERVNDVWEREGRPRIRIRIGLHCANVLVGNVGSSTRPSYTALGDGVNAAARLEGMNKLFGTTICISDSIYEQVHTEILVRPLKRVQFKGRRTEFMIYELLAFRASDDPELRIRERDEQLSAMTWKASDLLEQGEFDEAANGFRDILRRFRGTLLPRLCSAISLSIFSLKSLLNTEEEHEFDQSQAIRGQRLLDHVVSVLVRIAPGQREFLVRRHGIADDPRSAFTGAAQGRLPRVALAGAEFRHGGQSVPANRPAIARAGTLARTVHHA